MPSTSFLSIYQQYKRDTDIVASWLVTTANQHGYTALLAIPLSARATIDKSAAPLSSRLKGKARKEAKKQQQRHVAPLVTDAKDTPGPSPKSKYILAIRDFVPLAEFIARKLTLTTSMEATNGTQIPLFFRTALERAIWARKTFSVHFSEANKHLNVEANTAHAYFVSVLEKVRCVLLKVEGGSGFKFNTMSKDSATNIIRDGSVAEAEISSCNLFQALQVYEPSEDFLNASDVVLPAPSPPIDIEYTVENDGSEVECIFAFTTLLKDLIRLRGEVSNLWNEYRSGKIDLAAAAVGSNLAIELARSMEEDMVPLLKRHGGALALLPKYFGIVCQSLCLDPSQKELCSDDMNFACYNIGATFLHNAASLLEAIRAAAPYSARLIPCYNGMFGWYDAQRADLETMDNRQRWAQDKAALLEVVSDIALLLELEGIPVIDEFARGVEYMFETREIPIWLCFAAQNYLDTLRFFGPNVTTALTEFQHFNKTTAKLLERVTVADSAESDVKKGFEQMRNMLKVEINGVDIFTVCKMTANRGTRNESPSRPSSFLLHNPIFCGLWIHYVRVLFHQTGVRYAARPGALLHAVQLCTAVRQQQQEHLASVLEWPDLDRLIAMQELQAFFVGMEPPTSPQAHFKNYCMSRGVSPANWLAAAKRCKGKGGKVLLQRSRAGFRGLRFRSPVSLYYAARIQKHAISASRRSACSADEMQQILEASGGFKLQQQEQVRINGGAGNESQAKAAADGNIKPEVKAAAARIHLNPPQIVHYFAHAIETEIPDLVFNYFVMHEMAQELLERLQAQADYIGLPLISHAMTDVADTVGLVFAIAATEVAPMSGQSQEVLDKVAVVMGEYVVNQLDVNKRLI
ncbi:hypothetical protein FAUST_7749 [Fusarium austroamericanum]|uniref:DUF6604 domain-containing protein n=1 Tax=Fusarium austroamericanum TaxID=282268 RepID=A0AAN6BYI7_FUSAU|nr:hypothetical protein FAUST_7749 [Fusarium austroamericanum]